MFFQDSRVRPVRTMVLLLLLGHFNVRVHMDFGDDDVMTFPSIQSDVVASCKCQGGKRDLRDHQGWLQRTGMRPRGIHVVDDLPRYVLYICIELINVPRSCLRHLFSRKTLVTLHYHDDRRRR